MKTTRREFLRRSCALSSLGFAANLGALLATGARAQALPATDYKALVCVFLYGGNDGNNTVVPIDAAGYAQYAAARPTSSGINLGQSELLPIQPANLATPFGLHPAMQGMQELFQQGRAAVLCNVGTLLKPITKADYLAGQARPDSLFSHSDQVAQWQAAISDEVSRTGWGGRLADRTAGWNATSGFPVITSASGSSLFATGVQSGPLTVPQSGGFGLAGFSSSAQSQARLDALRRLLAADRGHTLVDGASGTLERAIGLSQVVSPILSSTTSAVTPLFSGQTGSLAQQLLQIAKLIEARATVGAARQVFFASLGGFDTHSGQAATQQTLLGQVSQALKAFHDATVQLGVDDRVTTFTLSDFGRTLRPAAGAGSDHAWGNHHFVLGGAVRGGAFYGTFPTLVAGGPDDVSSEGRWLPTTSVDQHAATLVTWFGLPAADLPYVLPNLASFPTADLGFMA